MVLSFKGKVKTLLFILDEEMRAHARLLKTFRFALALFFLWLFIEASCFHYTRSLVSVKWISSD
jgi:hypothetical protein